jgi:hypothetical protein
VTKQTAIKLSVEVGPDHTIKLPAEVPEGPAEVIVLVTEQAAAVAAPPDALGLFKDEPEIVDQMMKHVRELRSRSRMRPAS